MPQDRLPGQQREQFTCHGSTKAHDFAGTDMGPFGVGARQTDHAVKPGICGKVARDLGFFAAHHVSGPGLFHTGQNTNAEPHLGCRSCGCVIGAWRRTRHSGIGRFGPALTRSDHAAGQHRQRQHVTAKFLQGRLEFGSAERAHAIARVPSIKDGSVCAHEPCPHM